MSVKIPILTVGYDKTGEFDFGISGDIADMEVKQMNEFRAMVICAIGTMEDMFRHEIMRRHPAASVTPKIV